MGETSVLNVKMVVLNCGCTFSIKRRIYESVDDLAEKDKHYELSLNVVNITITCLFDSF